MNREELYAGAKETARWKRGVAVLRLIGHCLGFAFLSWFAGMCLLSAIRESEHLLLGLLIMLLTAAAWFLGFYLIYKKIDEDITELRDIRFDLDRTGTGSFSEAAQENSVISSRQTLLTPEFIMTRGLLDSRLPLQSITALTIEPHTGKHPFLLLKAYSGTDCRFYRVECCEDYYRKEWFLRETAARITECFRIYAPQCSISSPYIESFEQPAAPVIRQRF